MAPAIQIQPKQIHRIQAAALAKGQASRSSRVADVTAAAIILVAWAALAFTLAHAWGWR